VRRTGSRRRGGLRYPSEAFFHALVDRTPENEMTDKAESKRIGGRAWSRTSSSLCRRSSRQRLVRIGGASVGKFERAFAESVGVQHSDRGAPLHRRAPSRATQPGLGAGRRSDRSDATWWLRRRHLLRRRHTGFRRHRPDHLVRHPARSRRASPTHQGDHHRDLYGAMPNMTTSPRCWRHGIPIIEDAAKQSRRLKVTPPAALVAPAPSVSTVRKR